MNGNKFLAAAQSYDLPGRSHVAIADPVRGAKPHHERFWLHGQPIGGLRSAAVALRAIFPRRLLAFHFGIFGFVLGCLLRTLQIATGLGALARNTPG
jgi:hypothetical protein